MPKFKTYFLITILCCVFSSSCTTTGKGQNYTDQTGPRYASLNQFTPQEKPVETLKVVTYNIKYAKKLQKAINLLRLNDKTVNADIILLQEMDSLSVKHIAEALEYNYVYYPASFHPFSNKDFGNAILSKWPMENDKKVILPHLDVNGLQRVAVGATVKVQDKKIFVYSIHMEIFLKSYQRKNQLSRIVHTISPSFKHCIIAGDFNTFTNAGLNAVLEIFEEGEFSLATKNIGWTFKSWYLLGSRPSLDHIFTRGFDVVASGKVKDRTASDHYPVWVEVKFED